jgi:hypothetical protein
MLRTGHKAVMGTICYKPISFFDWDIYQQTYQNHTSAIVLYVSLLRLKAGMRVLANMLLGTKVLELFVLRFNIQIFSTQLRNATH